MNNSNIEKVHTTFQKITEKLIHSNVTASAMESCTSGLLTSLLTDTEGASAVIRGGIVAYSNGIKVANGVPSEIIDKYSVYSIETAHAMAESVMKSFGTEIGIGVTGCLGRKDPENETGIPGEVYYSVMSESGIREGKLILGRCISRFEDKLEACEKIGKEILFLLDKISK